MLTVKDFFGSIFINSYVCALDKVDKHQMAGSMPTEFCGSDDEINNFFETKYFPLNKIYGHGIHFTPNGIKSIEGRNRKENFSHINSWFIDIDIEETKHIKDEADKWKRVETKERILGKIFSLDPNFWPSLTVETRNGYHIYWFALPIASPDNFSYIQSRLLSLFSEFGADEGASGIMSTLRVPYFWYDKDGETGQILPCESLSTERLYKEEDMMSWLRNVQPHAKSKEGLVLANLEKPGSRTLKVNLFRSERHGIFSRALLFPVKRILENLSGSHWVRGEIFSFQRVSGGKWNLLANGKMTPNWIDENLNLVFSNNEPNFCSIIHFLKWYSYDNKQIAQIFYDLKI